MDIEYIFLQLNQFKNSLKVVDISSRTNSRISLKPDKFISFKATLKKDTYFN